MMRRLRAALYRDRGASAVEYGLMVAAVAAVIVIVVFGFGSVLKDTFTITSQCIENEGVGNPFPDC